MNVFGYNLGWRGRMAPFTNPEEAWWSSNFEEMPRDIEEDSRADVSDSYKNYTKGLWCDAGHEGFHKVRDKRRFRVQCSEYPRCKVMWSKNQLLDRILEVIATEAAPPARGTEQEEDAEDEQADCREFRRIRQEVGFVRSGTRWTWRNHKGRVRLGWWIFNFDRLHWTATTGLHRKVIIEPIFDFDIMRVPVILVRVHDHTWLLWGWSVHY